MPNSATILLISISFCILVANCSALDNAQAIVDETRSGVEKNAQVYEEDAFNTVEMAKNFNLIN